MGVPFYRQSTTSGEFLILCGGFICGTSTGWRNTGVHGTRLIKGLRFHAVEFKNLHGINNVVCFYKKKI